MAVDTSAYSLSSGDFSAFVRVRGKPVEIYGIETASGKVHGYIESSGGTQFTVVHKNSLEGTKTGWDVSTFVDGRKVAGVVYLPDSDIYRYPKDSFVREQEAKGYHDTPATCQPFLFGKTLTTNNDNLNCKDAVLNSLLGTIQVRVLRVDKIRAADTEETYGDLDPKTFSETLTKGLSHQTKLGPPQAVPRETRCTFNLIDPVAEPFLTLEFRYRSKAILECQGLLPTLVAQASPAPSSSSLSLLSFTSSVDEEFHEHTLHPKPESDLEQIRAHATLEFG